MIVRTAIALIACAVALGTTSVAQTRTPVNVCGTMTVYQPRTATSSGHITVAGEQFSISTDAQQNISPDARVGSDVCLTGAWVMSQTSGRNLIEITVVPRSPTTSAPGTSTPSTPSTLPATSAAPATTQSDPLPLVAILAVAGLAALLVVLRIRRT